MTCELSLNTFSKKYVLIGLFVLFPKRPDKNKREYFAQNPNETPDHCVSCVLLRDDVQMR